MNQKPRVIVRGLALIASLILVAFAFERLGLKQLLSEQWIDDSIRGHGWYGLALFMVMGGMTTAVGLPRQLVGFFGGYAFGLWAGLLISTMAALFGCVLTFYYARLLGRDLLAKKLPERIRKLDHFLQIHPFSSALLLRLLPVGSNLLTSIVAGISGIRALPFFAGSGIGYVPQMLVFSLAGSGISMQPELRIGLAAVLFVASGLLGFYLLKRFKNFVPQGEENAA